MLLDLTLEAARMAALGAEEAELAVAALTTDAIARWKLDEATFWQRVRFRSRMLRAQCAGAALVARSGGSTC